jgi:glycerophosphoryl diester phosphodiesterase
MAKAVLEAGLQLFTYGKRNNDEAAVAVQVAAGVQGIIVDHVAHIARHMGTAPALPKA